MKSSKVAVVICAVSLVVLFGSSDGMCKTFPIGSFFAMTGAGAPVGRAQSQGALIAIDQINAAGGVAGYNFDLIITDFKNTDVNLAVTGVRKMISVDKIPAVLASYSAPTLATQPICEKAKVLMLNGGAYSPKLVGKPYLYTIRLAAHQIVPALLKFLWERDVRRLGLLYISDPSGIMPVEEYIKPIWTKMGGAIVADEPHQSGLTDLSPSMARIKAGKPDAIISYSTGESIAFGVKQAREAGMNVPIVVVDWMKDYQTIAGTTSKNVFTAVDFLDRKSEDPYTIRFIKDYESKFKDAVDPYAANYYDAVMIIAELVKRVVAKGGDPMQGEQLEKAIWDKPSFKNVFGGNTVIKKDGSVAKQIVIFEVVGGELKVVQKVLE
jgi:branched-chain amino acid transport system substrate-binding protein